ncbi:MAG: lamin tail domain-containing protein [Bryocella sp.]
MQNFSRVTRVLRIFCFCITAIFACGVMWGSGSTTVVISQVYGGGGGASGTYNADYAELFNLGSTSVDISGYAVQYASALNVASATAFAIPAGTTLAPGKYYLVAATAGTGLANLPVTPDVTFSGIGFSGSNGKVFLTNNSTALVLNASGCPASATGVVDFVGYGTVAGTGANCFEGAGAAPTLTSTTAAIRTNPCTDTDNNGADFSSGAPNPHTSATAKVTCPTQAPVAFSATAKFTPSSATAGTTTLLTSTVTPATQPASTGITVTANLSAFGGSTTAVLHDDGANGDATAGDNIFSYSLSVPGAQALQSYTVTVTAKDQTTTVTPTAALTVIAPVVPVTTITLTASPTKVVINSSATLTAVVSGNTSAAPTGVVKFYDGATVLGNGVASSAGANTTYTYTATLTSLGAHTITATYAGDATYPGNTTTVPSSVAVTVTPVPTPDFTVSVANTSLVATSSSKLQSTVVTVGFVAGYNTPVALSCSGLPSGSRCVFSPTTLSATGNSTLTIGIDGASNRKEPMGAAGRTTLALAAFALPLLWWRRRKMAGVMLAVVLLGVMALGVTGCSGASSTTLGTSTVTVTGTGGSTTHTATFTLVVQ